MTERNKLLRQIAEYDFVVLELHMYLDSHPFDTNIAKQLDEYAQKLNALKQEFISKFGPITQKTDERNQWAWISSPWPWDNEEV